LTRTGLAVLPVALALAFVPSSSASTITGKAPGKPAVFNGSPVGGVLAIAPATASAKAGARYAKGGRYRLTVPRGTYLVLAPVRGKGGRVVTTRSRIFRLRKGQRRKVATTKKTPRPRKKKKKSKASRRAQAAAGQLLKVSVFGSRVTGQGFEVLSRGLDSMIEVDLFPAKNGVPCPLEVYVDRQSDAFRAVQAEVRLQQSPAFDPSTRVRPLYNLPRYRPKYRITATLRGSGNSLTGSIVARQLSNGRVKASQPVRRRADSVLQGFQSELHALLMELCEPGPPETYSGSVSGTARYDEGELGTGNHLDANWNAPVSLRRAAPLPVPGAPLAAYKLVSGTLHYSFRGHLNDCSVEGSGPVDLPSQPDIGPLPSVLEFYDDDPRTYRFQIPIPLFATVPGTQSGCDDPNEEGEGFDLNIALGVPWLVSAPLPGGPVADDWSLSGTGSGNNGPGSPDQTWGWSLSPAG
jgi:hypothetical protein